MLKKCIGIENEVRGLPRLVGAKLRAGIRHRAFDAAARPAIEDSNALRQALVPLLDVRLELYKTFLEMDRRVKAQA